MINLKHRRILGLKYDSDLLKAKNIFRDVNSNYSELLREKLLINIKGGIHNTQDDMTFLLFKKMKP